ncbi:zona pellucida sperm-binding protein 3d.2 [Synchiropus picturatus]
MKMGCSLSMAALVLFAWTNGEALESLNQTVLGVNKVSLRHGLTSPRPYLQLPVYVDSGQPPVEKQHLFPNWGTGSEGLPGFLRSVLLPETPESTPLSDSAVSVKASCYSNKMLVEVPRSIWGKDEPPSRFKLGTCSVSSATTDYLYFEYDVDLCGTKITVINGRVAYSNTLHYEPPTLQGSIRRAAPFTLPVACVYNRYHYSYKVGYTPRLQRRKIYKPMQNRNEFSLSPRNAAWQPLSPTDKYLLGSPMYFQAEGQFVPDGQQLYVHTCFATPEKTFTSSTVRFSVVENFGCMVESKSSHSRFIPFRNNIVRFMVDAFLFKEMSSQVYMHCTMSVESFIPTSTSKSCNYDRDKKRWVELHGSDSVCACCDSVCISDGSAAPRMVSSAAWPLEPEVKHSLSQNLTSITGATSSKTPSSSATRKLSPTSSRTKTKPLPAKRSRKVPERRSTSKPKVTSGSTVMGNSAVEFKNPVRGRGLKRGGERWTDGFAVVEEDQGTLRRLDEYVYLVVHLLICFLEGSFQPHGVVLPQQLLANKSDRVLLGP